MAIEQWGFVRMPHLLIEGTSVYNGQLQGPMIHAFCPAFGRGAAPTWWPGFETKWATAAVKTNNNFRLWAKKWFVISFIWTSWNTRSSDYLSNFGCCLFPLNFFWTFDFLNTSVYSNISYESVPHKRMSMMMSFYSSQKTNMQTNHYSPPKYSRNCSVSLKGIERQYVL